MKPWNAEKNSEKADLLGIIAEFGNLLHFVVVAYVDLLKLYFYLS